MNALVIVLVVLVVAGVVALLAFNPVIAKRNDAAIAACKEALGGQAVVRILEPRVVGFASEPEEAGGLRGQGCLGASDDRIVFVSTVGAKRYEIDRSTVTRVDTSGDPRDPAKATIEVTYTDPTHGEVTASWRLPDPPDWLKVLGYDWGPEGPPADAADDDPGDDGAG